MERERFDELVKEFVDLYCSDYFDNAATQIEYDANGEGMHLAYVSLVDISGKTRRVVLCPSADDPDGICIEACEDSYLDADTGGLCCVLWNQAEMDVIRLGDRVKQAEKHIAELERQRDEARAQRDAAQQARDGAYDAQDALMEQTVRIRRVLSPEVRDGVDTEAIAREVVRERDTLRVTSTNLQKLAYVKGEEGNRLRALIEHAGLTPGYQMILCRNIKTGQQSYQQVFRDNAGAPAGYEMLLGDDEVIWWPGPVEQWPEMWRNRFERITQLAKSVCESAARNGRHHAKKEDCKTEV